MGGQGKRVDEVFLGRPQRFRQQRQPMDDDCSPGRGEIAQNGGTRGGKFQCKMNRCREKAKAGLRHAVVCPKGTGRTKEGISQSKRARDGSLALVD